MSHLKKFFISSIQAFFITLVLAQSSIAQSLCSNQTGFDFDNGNGLLEIVFPTFPIELIISDISPSVGDASLLLRFTTLLNNAAFDAVAPYHPTAVGVYSHLGRRPASESLTNANINTALLYSTARVLADFLPRREQDLRDMLCNVGLDPDDNSLDLTTAVGIGNSAGLALIEGRQNDGMNQLGNEGDTIYNASPYSDYTSYSPVNTAYRLKRPGRWQPDINRQGIGLYKVQQFVTPQYANVEPYAYPSPRVFRFPFPIKSRFFNRPAYRQQADEVLQVSAALTEEQKIKAEFFDNKLFSLGFSAIFASTSRGRPLIDFVQSEFLANMAAFDAGIVVWQEKRRFDAVRPFSAIRHLYGSQVVTAWGGVGQGTVNDIPADQWRAYLPSADHPEYPSASACFCHAQAQAMRRYYGTDELNFGFPFAAGSSRIEPGISPATDILLTWATWTDLAADCGQSRVWAGVHFQDAVDASAQQCAQFGDLAYDYTQSLINGTASLRPPSERLPNDWRRGY